MPSKLSEHEFKKGKFTTPLNTIMTSISDDKSWTYGRSAGIFMDRINFQAIW